MSKVFRGTAISNGEGSIDHRTFTYRDPGFGFNARFSRADLHPTFLRNGRGCDSKSNRTPGGDMVRGISKLRNERSLYLIQQNLNKRSLCVDFRKPEGIALIRDLVPHCDVVVENFRPGVLASLGLGYDKLTT